MPCHAFSPPSLPLSSFIQPIDRWMCHKPCFSKLGMHGKHQGAIPRNWFCGAAPRELHLMSTVGTRVSGLRTTLEETLLKIWRNRRWSLPLKSSRFSGGRQIGYVMQYGKNQWSCGAAGRGSNTAGSLGRGPSTVCSARSVFPGSQSISQWIVRTSVSNQKTYL